MQSKKRQPISALPSIGAAEGPSSELGWNSDRATCEPAGGAGLASRLHSLLASPPDEPPDWAAIAGGASLEERAALYADMAFWVDPIWDDAPADPSAVRRAVDPLGSLGPSMASLNAEGRASLARDLAVAVPDFSTRVLIDATLRAALLDGLTPVGGMQVLHAVTHPDQELTQPYELLQRSVLGGRSETVREAWSELSVDPTITLRLSRDLELRQRLRALDAELADQIDWELSRTLGGDFLTDEADLLESAARPALRALAPLTEPSLFGANLAPMVGAVTAYLTDVRTRRAALDAHCVPSGSEGGDGPAVDHLRRRFSDFFGLTLGEALGGDPRTTAETLRDLLELDRATPESPLAEERDWEAALRAEARRSATRVHAASRVGWLGGPDPDAVLEALESARSTLRDKASAGVSAVEAESRTELATTWLGESYEMLFGPIGALLGLFEEPAKRQRAARCLGDGSGALSLAVRGVVAGGQGASGTAEQALLVLTDEATDLGLQLASAVQEADGASARDAAEIYNAKVTSAVVAEKVPKDIRPRLATVIEAAYAPLGGSLRGGIATLDNADTVFSLIGLHSTGAALRASGDDRSDNALAGEHRVVQQLQEVFNGVVTAREGFVRKAMTNIRADLPAVVAESDFDDGDAYLADRYLRLHGIDLGLHIQRSDLPEAFKSELHDRFPARGAAAAEANTGTHGATVSPDFFSIGGPVPSGVDADQVSDPTHIERMTEVHVERLTALAEKLGGFSLFGALTEATDGVVAFRHYLADLTMIGELDRVEQAFAQRNGATLGFYVRQAEAQGGLTGKAAAGLELDLERADELSALSITLRREADSKGWSKLVEQSERADLDARDAVLQDHETLAYVRERIPAPVVWRALWDSLNGELKVADLLRDESSLQDWMEFVGTAAWWGAVIGTTGGFALLDAIGINPQEALFGVDEDEDLTDFDISAILTARRGKMSVSEASLDGARAAVDADAASKLDQTVSGDNRLDALSELAHTQEGAGEADVAQQEHLGMGGQGITDAAKVDDDWFKQTSLREAILAMSEDERALMARDVIFLERLAAVTEGDPGAATELMGLLLEGADSAHAARLAAYGGGVEWNLFDEPWSAV